MSEITAPYWSPPFEPWDWCSQWGFQSLIAEMCEGADNGDAMRAALSGLITGYAHRWLEDNFEIFVEHIEATLTGDLVNLDTNRTSRTYSLAGKVDKIAMVNGQRCLFDHKTTTQDVTDPASNYWRRLRIDGQGQLYQILCLSNGIPIDRVVWDVVRRPTWRMKKLTKVLLEELRAVGTYHFHGVSTESKTEVLQTGVENWELLAYRIAAASISDPQQFFVRTTIPRSKPELVRFNDKLWRIADEMRRARRLEIEDQIENWGACNSYGTSCEYLPICSGSDTLETDKWQTVEHVHPELEMEGKDEKSIVTHSRISCFLACRKKHHLKYELGRRRADDDRGSEALWFGTAWHTLMDHFWSISTREDDGNDDEGSPAREAGHPEDQG
jgi:hypothetical protein